jgi:hypothetical protein
MEKAGVKPVITGVIDELIELASANGCHFSPEFKQNVIKEQCQSSENTSIMWQDYVARRPMEVETFLGSPIKIPRVEALYAVFHNLNIINQTRPKETNGFAPGPGGPSSPSAQSVMPRISASGPVRPPPGAMNGNGMGRGRPRASSNFSGPPPGKRRPPPPNGYRPHMNGGPNGNYSRQPSRRGSMDETDLGEFSHLVVYDDEADGGYPADGGDLSMRDREMQLRQRELALKEQEMRMRRAGPPPRRRGPPPRGAASVYGDDDEEDDYFDPNSSPMAPMIDPDNFDMMSVTSRKNRSKAPPSQSQVRANPEGLAPGASRSSRWRPSLGRNRSSQILNSAPLHQTDFLDDPLMNCSSNRYGNVDRGQMHQNQAGSRSNSLTASHMQELQTNGMNGPFPRRTSHSPGNPYSPSVGGGRPSPPNGFGGPGYNGRPSPPDGVRQPIPRHPPGHGNSVAPQQVEQRLGVSTLQPPKPRTMRSLTGSASASAGSGDSANLDSEPSAHSSQSSLGPRPPIGVR